MPAHAERLGRPGGEVRRLRVVRDRPVQEGERQPAAVALPRRGHLQAVSRLHQVLAVREDTGAGQQRGAREGLADRPRVHQRGLHGAAAPPHGAPAPRPGPPLGPARRVAGCAALRATACDARRRGARPGALFPAEGSSGVRAGDGARDRGTLLPRRRLQHRRHSARAMVAENVHGGPGLPQVRPLEAPEAAAVVRGDGGAALFQAHHGGSRAHHRGLLGVC
mmetsp:Transcript_60077/g.169429  ORF Transcript_60077/g.169429 Transcript_60077/m.169429 type:complete len:222 (+) Transcript_60077:170-835(+)